MTGWKRARGNRTTTARAALFKVMLASVLSGPRDEEPAGRRDGCLDAYHFCDSRNDHRPIGEGVPSSPVLVKHPAHPGAERSQQTIRLVPPAECSIHPIGDRHGCRAHHERHRAVEPPDACSGVEADLHLPNVHERTLVRRATRGPTRSHPPRTRPVGATWTADPSVHRAAAGAPVYGNGAWSADREGGESSAR
jgi:hypothetical protein